MYYQSPLIDLQIGCPSSFTQFSTTTPPPPPPPPPPMHHPWSTFYRNWSTETVSCVVTNHPCQYSGKQKAELSKAKNTVRSLNAVWRSLQYCIKIRNKLNQSCVLLTLPYGSECWRMTEHDLAKLSSFHTASLRKIQRIFWPRTISNPDLLARCQQEDMETIIIRKRWRWIGHVLCKHANSSPKLQSTGFQRESGSVVDRRQPGEELWKWK